MDINNRMIILFVDWNIPNPGSNPALLAGLYSLKVQRAALRLI
jgi:hypothetical protein